MPCTLRTSEAPFEEPIEQIEPVAIADVPVSQGLYGDHPRALQRRLAEAYGARSLVSKLPVVQRVGIIVGASAALWTAIGAGVALAL